jgi:hypothetical protein
MREATAPPIGRQMMVQLTRTGSMKLLADHLPEGLPLDRDE